MIPIQQNPLLDHTASRLVKMAVIKFKIIWVDNFAQYRGCLISRKLKVAPYRAHLCDVQESGSKTDRAGWQRAVYIFTYCYSAHRIAPWAMWKQKKERLFVFRWITKSEIDYQLSWNIGAREAMWTWLDIFALKTLTFTCLIHLHSELLWSLETCSDNHPTVSSLRVKPLRVIFSFLGVSHNIVFFSFVFLMINVLYEAI